MSDKVYEGRWQTLRQIGKGGQGLVYRVKDLTTDDENFVLKRLKNEDGLDRFKREIEALQNIDSPFVGKIIDSSTTDENEYYYYVMPYIKNSLHDILFQLKGDLGRSLTIFQKICLGVEQAHQQKSPIIHRDLKPANIMIDGTDTPKIIDFGICLLDETTRLTLTQEQVGSKFYIPPECEMGKSKDIGPHTDIYSLGKVLYAMVTGGEVFPREKQNDEDYRLDKIIKNGKIKYVSEIVDKCVVEDINGRINLDGLKKMVQKNIRLIEGGFFPVDYGNEICRFCGSYRLNEFGQLTGPIFLDGETTRDITPYGMRLWGCQSCGMVYLFNDAVHKMHKS